MKYSNKDGVQCGYSIHKIAKIFVVSHVREVLCYEIKPVEKPSQGPSDFVLVKFTCLQNILDKLLEINTEIHHCIDIFGP